MLTFPENNNREGPRTLTAAVDTRQHIGAINERIRLTNNDNVRNN